MENRGALLNILPIIAILVVVFLSQQPFMRPLGRSFYAWERGKIGQYTSEATDWAKSKILPQLTQEAEKRGEPLQQEAIAQKDNAMQFVWEKIKNYFAEMFSKYSGTKVE